jgi:hypothetical protein
VIVATRDQGEQAHGVRRARRMIGRGNLNLRVKLAGRAVQTSAHLIDHVLPPERGWKKVVIRSTVGT